MQGAKLSSNLCCLLAVEYLPLSPVFEVIQKLPDPYALPDNEQDEAILGSTYIAQMKEAHRKKVAMMKMFSMDKGLFKEPFD